ncbi:MAG: threonylcarbamoyl-AMP synthase [Clostridia bacterium]|nr:threonylcarbamoyl-AMP synthase [Clostridia bacterium]
METKLLHQGEEKLAAEILAAGGLVALPTETVYGLGADGLNEEAIKKIFIAKGRPADNPLILHIAEPQDILDLVLTLPPKASTLIDEFWPGPLTVILPKTKTVPSAVSADLPNVAVRCPANESIRLVIKYLKRPIAAPSANISGKPSPTKVSHVLQDLNGKIDAILDGGDCELGLESTVVSFVSKAPCILRPGSITKEQMEDLVGDIAVDPAVLGRIKQGQKALSPGMKYTHYAPRAKVVVVKADKETYIDFVNKNSSENILSLCFEEDKARINGKSISYGKEKDTTSQANLFFDALRKIDNLPEIELVYARCPYMQGVGLAVYNRLIRAAGFEVIEL